MLALIGASGSGKTTLLRSLNRLTEITAGAVRAGRIALDGEEIEQIEVNDLRRRVSMVFQQPNPFPMSIFGECRLRAAMRGAPPGGPPARAPAAEWSQAGESDALRRAGSTTEVAADLDHRRCACRVVSSSGVHRACAGRQAGGACCCWTSRARRDPISTATIEQLMVGVRADGGDRDRHAQPAAGDARGRPRLALGELVEYGSSAQVFDNPAPSARARLRRRGSVRRSGDGPRAWRGRARRLARGL